MGHNRGHISENFLYKCTSLIHNNLYIVKVKVEILTVNEMVSFLVKHNQFYQEAILTCPLYRSTEDICIGIYVFKRVFNMWHMLKKKYVNATTF